MDGTVTEVKYDPAGDTIAVGELDQVTVREDFPFERPEYEEPVHHAFGTTYGDEFRRQDEGAQQRGEDEETLKETSSHNESRVEQELDR